MSRRQGRSRDRRVVEHPLGGGKDRRRRVGGGHGKKWAVFGAVQNGLDRRPALNSFRITRSVQLRDQGMRRALVREPPPYLCCMVKPGGTRSSELPGRGETRRASFLAG